MWLKATHPHLEAAPCYAVERVHRIHVQFTYEYKEFTEAFLGYYFPHRYAKESKKAELHATHRVLIQYFPLLNHSLWSDEQEVIKEVTPESRFTDRPSKQKASLIKAIIIYLFVSLSMACVIYLYPEKADTISEHIISYTDGTLEELLKIKNTNKADTKITLYFLAITSVAGIVTLILQRKWLTPIQSKIRSVLEGSVPHSPIHNLLQSKSFHELSADSSTLINKLSNDFGLSVDIIQNTLIEYFKFLYLFIKYQSGGALPVPSALIDAVWRLHITFTESYAETCQEVAGRTIHYTPPPIHSDNHARQEESARAYQETKEKYTSIYKQKAPDEFWPQDAQENDPKLLWGKKKIGIVFRALFLRIQYYIVFFLNITRRTFGRLCARQSQNSGTNLLSF